MKKLNATGEFQNIQESFKIKELIPLWPQHYMVRPKPNIATLVWHILKQDHAYLQLSLIVIEGLDYLQSFLLISKK
jgi:hypothetical protein